MNIYFLFTNVKDEYICKYIYTSENSKVYSYSYEEGYIVKSEESSYKSLKEIESNYATKSKGKKGGKQTQPPILMKKEFSDVRHSLFYLNGTLENFNNEIPARKRLPEIINPYDMDFEETEDYDSFGERGFEETEGESKKSDFDFDDEPLEDDVYEEDPFDDNDPFKDNYDTEDDDFDDDDEGYYRK